MKHVLRLITVAVVLLLVVFGFYEYKRSHTTKETYPGVEDLAENEPERKVTLLPIAGGDETVTRVENATGGDKAVSNKNEGKTENKVTPQMLPTAAPTATPEPIATATAVPTATPVAEDPVTENEPKATPYVLALENQPGVQEGWGKIRSSITASLTMSSLPQQGAGSVKRVDSTKSTSVLISSEMPLKMYGLYEGDQGKLYRHVGVTYVGNEYYGYILADRVEECAEEDVVLPTPTATAVPAPTEVPVWRPTATAAPIPTATPVWRPTATPVPTVGPVWTPTTRPVATATPRPTAGPVWVPTATPRPTNAPVWVPTPTPIPIATATPVPTPTARPVATATPRPTATPVPTPNPMPTTTPIPTATPVPVLERVTAGEYDYRVIPDKHNTGCSGSLTKINSACTVDGVEYSLGNNGTMLVIDWYYRNKDAATDIVIRNVDFSELDFGIRNAASVDVQRTVRFENCKFGNVSVEVEQESAQYIFVDCSFVRFQGSNSSFENCFFGGSSGDAMNPFRNITVIDSYFCEFPQWNDNGIHTDAVQVYGKADIDAMNITFSNCRIEIPIIKVDGRKTLINACLAVGMEYSNAQNFLFEDCIINGGGYSIYATKKGDWVLDDVVFRNISVGKGRLFGEIYPHIADGVVFDNVYSTEQLYVASVWRDSLGKIHLSVTNDTAEDKFLIVVTENGRQEIFIPCKATAEAEGAREYYDLPIDIEVVTADAGSSWVVCYDGEETAENQIRFVNWGYSEVYREIK